MEDDGSRFRNLEKKLGEGATLALGVRLGESYWRKFLPKSGVDAFVKRARETRLPELSMEFADLRKKIVKHYLDELRSAEQCHGSSASDPQHVAFDGPSQTQGLKDR